MARLDRRKIARPDSYVLREFEDELAKAVELSSFIPLLICTGGTSARNQPLRRSGSGCREVVSGSP